MKCIFFMCKTKTFFKKIQIIHHVIQHVQRGDVGSSGVFETPRKLLVLGVAYMGGGVFTCLKIIRKFVFIVLTFPI